jgi:tetratricopeptide (TPR) repeat protein
VGRFDEAEKEFMEELKINPEDYMSLWKMGNICLFRGRWDEGIPYLEKATRLAPNLPQAHRDLGKAYF